MDLTWIEKYGLDCTHFLCDVPFAQIALKNEVFFWIKYKIRSEVGFCLLI